jgi:hypothetical protein
MKAMVAISLDLRLLVATHAKDGLREDVVELDEVETTLVSER